MNSQKIQCLNSGKSGHQFKSCDEPVISYGVICFNLNSTLNLTNKSIKNYFYNKYIDIEEFNYSNLNNLKNIRMKQQFLLYIFLIQGFLSTCLADEGMLIPSLIAVFESDMKEKGMKLSADEIYSVNHSSLKDAILQFGGGCTAELVSSKGLLVLRFLLNKGFSIKRSKFNC